MIDPNLIVAAGGIIGTAVSIPIIKSIIDAYRSEKKNTTTHNRKNASEGRNTSSNDTFISPLLIVDGSPINSDQQLSPSDDSSRGFVAALYEIFGSTAAPSTPDNSSHSGSSHPSLDFGGGNGGGGGGCGGGGCGGGGCGGGGCGG